MDTLLVAGLLAVLVLTSSVQAELRAEFLDHSPRHLLLTCSTGDLPHPVTHVISISIMNGTTPRDDDLLAWLPSSDGVPRAAKVSGRFVSGVLQQGDTTGCRLQLLVLDHDPSRPAAFSCRIAVMRHKATIEHVEYQAHVDVPKEKGFRLPDRASTPAPTVTTKNPKSADGPVVRTGSVLQPTVLEAGIPMSVLIVMLVLITLLLLVTSALLLQKFRGRCGAQPVAYPPPHYGLAGTGLDAWDERLGGMKGSRPSLQTMVGLRSHYSLPRPLQPPPPPPKLQRSKSRDSGDYAVTCGVPAGMTRSFHYTTPYDAIVQDEDGELSLLNTSAHCDVTPALPPELAGEPAYKVPRAEAEAQTQGQGHSMYSSASLKGSPLELE